MKAVAFFYADFFQTEIMLTTLWPWHETSVKQVLVDKGVSFGEEKTMPLL